MPFKISWGNGELFQEQLGFAAFNKEMRDALLACTRSRDCVHFMYYNFARIHQSLRVTPAMAAGVSDHVWSLEEIVGLVY